jgi:flagellar biosynthesis/type III secretory pathway protein FliH
MSLLEAAGLKPAPGDEPGVAPVEEPQVAPEAPEKPEDESVEIPEGAKNPDAVKALIAAERKTAREANARAREFERQAAEAAEANKPLEERLANAERKAQEAELNALRVEVGTNLGLSLTLSKRLSGQTVEELAADANTLIAELGNRPKPQVPGLDGGVKTPPPSPKDPTQVHNAWLGQLIAGKRQGA